MPAIRNIKLFIAFRILFNNRLYYPVFTILFLDYGLTVEQFSLLNTIWAVTIVLAEVPSGALADIIGRKTLLVTTALLMVAEMSLLAFVPLGNTSLVFTVFLINRVCSGLAEALTSGADEAMAYDSLVERGQAELWPKILSLQMRCSSLAFVVTSIVGALVYDPAAMNRLLAWLSIPGELSQQTTMRFPIYFTLLFALGALAVSLLFEEKARPAASVPGSGFAAHLRASWHLTRIAGGWILQTPFALAVILAGMFYDHILRLTVTLTSQYFRLISLPEASFGFISAAVSLMGIFIPRMAEWMVARYSPCQNMLWLALISLTGLGLLAGFFPYIGILAVALVFMGMMLTSFFTSHYLNRITDSGHRATVLSFKGLAFNLAYGLIGLLFALLMQYQRQSEAIRHPALAARQLEDGAFVQAVAWLPWYSICSLAVLFFLLRWRLATCQDQHRKG